MPESEQELDFVSQIFKCRPLFLLVGPLDFQLQQPIFNSFDA